MDEFNDPLENSAVFHSDNNEAWADGVSLNEITQSIINDISDNDELDMHSNYIELEHSDYMGGSSSDEAAESLAFKGSEDTYNYEYYKHQAELHLEAAERYENDAQDRYDWADRYSDDPSKALQYINEGDNWSSKANSEYQAYQDDLDKANSYK